MVIPAARSLHWRYQVLRQAFFLCKEKIEPGEDISVNLEALTTAASSILVRLQSGNILIHGRRTQINGDVAMLFKADDFTPAEKTLLRSYLRVTQSIAGCQALRRRVGHCLFGLRVVYGDVIFVTASPNRRHSHLLLRVSRIRSNDTMHLASGTHARVRKANAGSDLPPLHWPSGTDLDDIMENLFVEYSEMDDEEKERHQEKVEHAAIELNIPSFRERQVLNAQDMLGSVHHYLIHMRVLLPLAFGIRMCFECPHCNEDQYTGIAINLAPQRAVDQATSCQSIQGSNGKLLGGYV